MPKFAFKLGRWYVGIRNRIQWLKTQINDENEIKIMKTAEEKAKEIQQYSNKMEATHQVLDLVYTPDEGQECFEGTEQECYEFIQQQGGATFMYKVVAIVRNSALANDR